MNTCILLVEYLFGGDEDAWSCVDESGKELDDGFRRVHYIKRIIVDCVETDKL